MAKPILVINYCIEGLDWEVIIQNLKSLKEVIEKSGANEDYYTFVLPVKSDSHVQVFYDKDLENSSYNELKKMIQGKLDNIK